MRHNNGGVPTLLDQPINQPANHLVNQEKSPNGVYLAETALSGWCRLHKMSQHSELDCQEFQTVASIFQYEVENNAGSQEMVPSVPYDSSVLVLNYAHFPQSKENVPKEEYDQLKEEVDQVCNGDKITQLFDENLVNDNGPRDEEEAYVEEVQTFQRLVKKYDLREFPHRHPQARCPFTTSIPLNNFNTPLDPNASNNPSLPQVSRQYLS